MKSNKCLNYGCRIGLVEFMGGHMLTKDNTYTRHLKGVKEGKEELRKLKDTFDCCPDCGHDIDWEDWGKRYRAVLGIPEPETNE